MIELAALAILVAQKGGAQVLGKAGSQLLSEIIGLQDRQLEQIEEANAKLGRIVVTVDLLRRRPLETARLHLQEAMAAPDEARKDHIEHAADYLLEAYAGEGDAATRAVVAREVALVRELVGRDSHEWWCKAVHDAFEAVESACAHVLELLGEPHTPPDNVSPDLTKDARKKGLRIRGRLLYGTDDETKFWYLVGRHLDAVENGDPIQDAQLDALPSTRAIYGLHHLHAVAQDTRTAALAADVDPERLPDLALHVYLGRTQNPCEGCYGRGHVYAGFLLSDDQKKDHVYPAAELTSRERAERLHRYLRARRRLPAFVDSGQYNPTARQLIRDHDDVADVWTVRWLCAATGELSEFAQIVKHAGIDGDARLTSLSDAERTRLLDLIKADQPLDLMLLRPWHPTTADRSRASDVWDEAQPLRSRLVDEDDPVILATLLKQLDRLDMEHDALFWGRAAPERERSPRCSDTDAR